MNEFKEQNGIMVHINTNELEQLGVNAANLMQPPTQDLLDNISEVLKTEYRRQRASEYPRIEDQLDTLYHGGYDAWKESIDAIKVKYPKPTE